VKARVIFVYTAMATGGSTTSLLEVLRNLDYERFDVDLMLLDSDGPLIGSVPPEVSIVRPRYRRFPRLGFRRRYFSFMYVLELVSAWRRSLAAGNPLVRSQCLAGPISRYYGQPPGPYDVAVGFLEFAPSAYVAHRVQADRKIGWLHVDYSGSRLLADVELGTLGLLSTIVLVSEANRRHFMDLYPSLASRCVVVENMLDEESVHRKANEPTAVQFPQPPSDFDINLVSNSRIVFAHKGLDRGLRALRSLLDEGLPTRVHWWVVGDGPDFEKMRRLVLSLALDEHVTMLGNLANPFPVVKAMDVFFIPSLYEGKPMAVTEAQILGLPVLATDYASAGEQIRDGVDGLIVRNDPEGILGGLRRLAVEPSLLSDLSEGARARVFPREATKQAITALLAMESRS